MESLAVSLAAKRLSKQWRFAKYVGKIYPISVDEPLEIEEES